MHIDPSRPASGQALKPLFVGSEVYRQPAFGKPQGPGDMDINTIGVEDSLGLDFDRFGAHQPACDTNPIAADIQKCTASQVLF